MRRRIFLPIGRITSHRRRRGGARHRHAQPAPLREAPERAAGARGPARPAGDASSRDGQIAGPWSTWRWTANRDGEWSLARVAVREHTGRLGPPRPPPPGRVGPGARADRPAGHPGHRQPARRARADAPRRPGQRPAGPARRPPQRGGRRARRRAPRRRARASCPSTTRWRSSSALDRERAADVLEEMDPDDAADLLAELPRPEQERAARPDGARRGRPGPPADELPAGHRGQRDDLGAGDPDAGRDGRRGAGPDPRAAAAPGRRRAGLRGPGADGHADRAATWAWSTSSGCCASRPSSILGGIVDSDIDPLRPETAAARRSPGGWRRTTWWRCRWSTSTTGWSAR